MFFTFYTDRKWLFSSKQREIVKMLIEWLSVCIMYNVTDEFGAKIIIVCIIIYSYG